VIFSGDKYNFAGKGLVECVCAHMQRRLPEFSQGAVNFDWDKRKTVNNLLPVSDMSG